ncbi:HET-domain-containing protein, partial [Cryphonectria parasitica EP155]
MAFQYKPLRVDEIRLLRLRAGRKGSLCSFEMVHVSLRSHPTYAALSYTWGPPGDTHSILLNGTHFRIRQNLHDALEQITLAWKQHVGYGGYLWVDAICINQDPVDTKALDERAVQVGHMTSIYTQASKVLVWLGLPANDIDNKIAFRLMKRFEKRYRQIFDVPGSETYRGWLGIIALWQKPWWVRAWIYQEATIPEK